MTDCVFCPDNWDNLDIVELEPPTCEDEFMKKWGDGRSAPEGGLEWDFDELRKRGKEHGIPSPDDMKTEIDRINDDKVK